MVSQEKQKKQKQNKINKNITDDNNYGLVSKHSYKHKSHIKLMYIYIYLLVNMHILRYILNVFYSMRIHVFLCLSGHFK